MISSAICYGLEVDQEAEQVSAGISGETVWASRKFRIRSFDADFARKSQNNLVQGQLLLIMEYLNREHGKHLLREHKTVEWYQELYTRRVLPQVEEEEAVPGRCIVCLGFGYLPSKTKSLLRSVHTSFLNILRTNYLLKNL